MRTCYVLPDRPRAGIVDVLAPGEFAPGHTISRIKVREEYRGQGVARELLAMVLADADLEQVSIWLEILPSGGMDFAQLEAWYKRHGFRWSKRVPGIMVRRPYASHLNEPNPLGCATNACP